jgi:squalene synthase HpnC/squalene synthase HpnD
MLRPGELEIADKLPRHSCSAADAQAYTRWLATHHYENFEVVSWLLPKSLHQHFYNVYAYCRWADDLADEIPETARALELLDWWEQELQICYHGRPRHPVFVALRQTIIAKEIPQQPFADLLKAFRQDQVVKRYETWEGMIDYCVYSANPVGRLVLYLCDYRDEHRQKLSDATCTALQLANFWQDVGRDLEKSRIYIPLDIAEKHGVSEQDILRRRFHQGYVNLMKELLTRTRTLFAEGAALPKLVDGRLSVDLDMFSRGGLAILDAIEDQGYDTLHKRPVVTKGKQGWLLVQAIIAKLRAGPGARGSARAITRAQHGASATLRSQRAGTSQRPDVAQSYEVCRDVARTSNSNFYYAFYLLPKAKRNALAALYAFNRLVDDVADESGELPVKQRALARWRAELDEAVTGVDQCFDGTGAMTFADGPGNASLAVLPALADTLERYEIPTRYLHDLISGAEMDLTIHSYATFERLREYCYRVAGTVGLTCTHVFGFRDSHAVDLAEKLGLAFQLTNIIRDVHEDFAAGRVYLPEEDLAKYNVVREDFGRSEATLGVRELLRFEADRAWQNYEEGAALLNLIDQDSRGALWLLVHTYSALLARIEAADFAVFGERVRLSKTEKMLCIAKARFGRLTEENILEKRDRDRRRTSGSGSQRRAG